MSTAKTDDQGVIVTCTHCGQKNRTPFARLSDIGQCGRCKAELPPPAVPIDIEREAHFNKLVAEAPLPVVVDYWAPWCGPCRMVAPELEKVAASNAGRFLVVKVNTEALPALGERFNIRSIPTMGVFVGGREINRTSGARPAAAIEVFVRDSVQASHPVQ